MQDSENNSPTKAGKEKKVGYMKAKLLNTIKTGVFNQAKNNVRHVQNIIQIEQH